MSVPASSRATSRDASGGRAGTVRLPRAAAVALALAVLLAGAATPLRAQAPAPDAGEGWRIGLTLGGIATGGLTVEYFRDAWSLDVTFGTFSFRDLGVSPVLKRYLGTRAARAYVGLGFWTILAAPADAERTGAALVARLPVGVDWNFTHEHYLGLDIALNRALAIRRPDPADERPLNQRLVPLPGIHYRWRP